MENLLTQSLAGYFIIYIALIILYTLFILKSKRITTDDKYLVILFTVALLPVGLVYGLYLIYSNSKSSQTN